MGNPHMYSISREPSNNPRKLVLPLHLEEETGSERLSELPQVREAGRSQAGIGY